MDQLPMLPPMLAIQQFVWTARIHHATSHRYPSHRGELWQFLHGVKTVKDLEDLEILCRYLKTYKALKTYKKKARALQAPPVIWNFRISKPPRGQEL